MGAEALRVGRRLVVLAIITASPAGCDARRTGGREDNRVPEAEFTAPVFLIDRPFSRVAGFVEVKPLSVMVADDRDGLVHSLSVEAGDLRTLGRRGRGPGEYLRPRELMPFGADSVMLHDPANRRLLVFSNEGVTGRVVNLPPFPVSKVLGVDSLARLYLRTPPSLDDAAGGRQDSTAIIRWDISRRAVDTLLWVREARSVVRTEVASAERGTQIARFAFPVPFAPEDDCAVTPTGYIVVARVQPFRIEWWSGGRLLSVGAAIAVDSVPVNAIDKLPYQKPAFRVDFEWPDISRPSCAEVLCLRRMVGCCGSNGRCRAELTRRIMKYSAAMGEDSCA